jgi:serine/threonine protein phosphatase PrpC
MMLSRTKLRCAGGTHPGLVRSNNEDRFYCDPGRGILLIVDGIGGHAAGEKAADIAVNMVRSRLERETGTASERIREAITVANNEIFRLARTNPDWHGMACVLTVAVVEDGSAVIGHVGDSRLYKIRSGRIQKVTHDHSPVGEREDSNDLSEADAMRHPRRNEVYRDVGTEEHTPDDPEFIELIRIPFEDDSALLLCSDGLSDQVTSNEILRAVTSHAGNPEAAIEQLIDAANGAGGKDNVSIVIAEGPTFAASAVETVEAKKPTGSPFAGRAAMFIYGLIALPAIYGLLVGVLLLAGFHVHVRFLTPLQPEPLVSPARVLVVGTTDGAQYSAIADALSQARPGDTVEVLSGEYREQVRLRDAVNITSRIPHAAILRVPAAASGAVTAITAESVKNVRVTGLRILADEKLPLAIGALLTNSDIELEDCEISGANIGIEIRGNGRPVLRANSVHDSAGSGIVISGDSTAWLSHNDIVRNGRNAREPHPGILVSGAGRPVLVGNVFSENGAQGIVIPQGMDTAPILKFNFFPSGEPVGRAQPEAAKGSQKQHRRRQ